MAEFNATVTERVNIFGLAPSDKWAEYNWGSFKWGEGTNQIPVGVRSVIAVTGAVTGAVGALGMSTQVQETQASAETVAVVPGIDVSESQATTSGLDDVNVRDAAGYYYVFPDRTTDGEEADVPTWASGTDQTTTWTSSSVTAASWS